MLALSLLRGAHAVMCSFWLPAAGAPQHCGSLAWARGEVHLLKASQDSSIHVLQLLGLLQLLACPVSGQG